MRPKVFICLVSLSLAACNYVPTDDENSPFSEVPAGSILILKRDIVVPPNRFVANLDEADERPNTISADEQSTYCILEMRSVHPVALTISPTKFRVVQAKDGVDYTLREPIQVAFAAFLPSTESHSTTLYLQSEQYPDVHSVMCEFDADFGRGFPLPVTTIRWALGGHFDLVIAPKIP